MNSVQESKNELDAAIRYAENAISSAKQTIESMEFRQEMAQKNYQEQTGREAALQAEVDELRDIIDRMGDDITGDSVTIKQLQDQNLELKEKVQELLADITMLKQQRAVRKEASEKMERELQRQKDIGQGYYDSMMSFKDALDELREEKQPTMPVIPKAVAIAIFREGMEYGAGGVCDELDGQTINISETGRTGNFEVSFERDVDLDDYLDTDYLRSKAIDNCDEEWVVDCLKTLCSDNKFECRIHGVDDQEEKKND